MRINFYVGPAAICLLLTASTYAMIMVGGKDPVKDAN